MPQAPPTPEAPPTPKAPPHAPGSTHTQGATVNPEDRRAAGQQGSGSSREDPGENSSRPS